jgi:hypothetical protein
VCLDIADVVRDAPTIRRKKIEDLREVGVDVDSSYTSRDGDVRLHDDLGNFGDLSAGAICIAVLLYVR